MFIHGGERVIRQELIIITPYLTSFEGKPGASFYDPVPWRTLDARYLPATRMSAEPEFMHE
jgi:hypothetical protein